ncbi:cucumber peeling cupredoxin-like [Tripterygium wilfordii]|uniref:Cucumber peeling cupredoxin-like n=1 Tax=Tripterygium wilfordii TaxID=458696 RepID=A0A7J7CYF0_TRIWF|nr:umecyanin-like [Tripterygium wilfordii]KAF5739090.1 cucumber peeling cupredoxin-like [Tripterygium wilfordii]
MARFVNVAVVVSFVSVVLMQCVAAQTVHVVGDSMGWTIPQSGAGAYDTWAASKTFRVGDILTFNFGAGDHDVLQVPKASYDGCTAANPIGNTITTAPANITITSAGDHYYICTFSQHCQFGQKLKITAVSSSPTPGGAPSPAYCPPDTTMPPAAHGPSPITPSPNSSSSTDLASIVVSFLSIVVGFGFIF